MRRASATAVMVVATGFLVVVGALLRAPGFSSRGLFFDDSWVVAAARSPLRTAVEGGMTTPGYMVALHCWIGVHGTATWWLQIPGFVLGLVGIVAMVVLVRSLRWWWPLPWIAGSIVAVCPALVIYSMRVKQYAFDLVAAEILLLCTAWWWDAPSTKRSAVLVGTVTIATFVSSACLVVDVGVVAVLVVACVERRSTWRHLAVPVAALGVEFVALEVLAFDRIPPSLTTWWSHFGNLLGRPPAQGLARGIEVSLSGFLGGLTGYPTVPLGHSLVGSHRVTATSTVVSVVVLALLLSGGAALVVRRRPIAVPVVVAMVSILASLATSVLGLAPFGGGRTDIVLYPSVIVLLCACLHLVVVRGRDAAPRRALGVAVLATAVVVYGVVGPTRAARYPGNRLAALAADVEHHVRPSDVILVGSFYTYEWADERLSPTTVSLAPTERSWLSSLHVVSTSSRVIVSSDFLGPDAHLMAAVRRVHRIWLITKPVEIFADATVLYLFRHGFHLTTTELREAGVDAFLLVANESPETSRPVARRQ